MIRTIGLAAIMLAVSGEAFADVTEEYRRAFVDVYPGDTPNPVEAILSGAEVIPQLEGSWAAASLLITDAVYDAELVQLGCDGVSIDITQTSPLEFLVVNNRPNGPNLTTRYAHAGGKYFQAHNDLAARIEVFLGGYPIDDLPDELVMSTLISPNTHPMTRLELYGPDVLVMEPVGLSPLILARCP